MDSLQSSPTGIDYSQFADTAPPDIDFSMFANDDLESEKLRLDIEQDQIRSRQSETFTTPKKLENLHEPAAPIDRRDDIDSFLVDVDGKNKMLAPAASAFKALQEYAKEEGLELTLNNAYRGYDEQARLYNAGYPAAQPGYSSHQTGLAADFNLPWGKGTKEEKRLVELANRFNWYQPYPDRDDEFHHFVHSKSPEDAMSIEAASHRGEMPDAGKRKPSKSPLTQKEAIVNNIADEFGLDPDLLRMQVTAESGWNPQAVSPVGAMGVLQIMPDTLVEVLGQMKSKGLIPDTVTSATYKTDEILQYRAGAFYMQQMREKTGTYPEALAAYNAGLGGLQNMKKTGRTYNETGEYVAKIMGVDRETADDWILNGTGPSGARSSKGNYYKTPGNPFETNLQFISGNPNIVEEYKKYGKLDSHIKAMAALFPDYGKDILTALEDPVIALTSTKPEEKLREQLKNFDASAYWQGMAKRAVNEFTFGISSWTDAFGIGRVEKDEQEAMDAVELDENSGWVKRLFTQAGPEVIGGIASLMSVAGVLGRFGKAATSEKLAASLIEKGSTSPNLISSTVSRWLTTSAENTFGQNLRAATAMGLLYTIPTSTAAYAREYNEAELKGADPEEAAAAALGAFVTSMQWGMGLSVAAPVLGNVGGAMAASVAKTGQAVSGTMSVAAKYGSDLTPESIKAIGGSIRNTYKGSWVEGMLERSSKFGWDALSASQKVPILGGFIKAVKALPDSVREGFVTHSNMYREHLRAFEARSNYISNMGAGRKAADLLDSSLNAQKLTLGSFLEDVKAARAEPAKIKEQINTRIQELLQGSPQGSVINEFAGLSPGAQSLIGEAGSTATGGATRIYQARQTLQEHLNPYGGSSRLASLERAMVANMKDGLTAVDVRNITASQRNLYNMGRKAELIDDAGLSYALKKLDEIDTNFASVPSSAAAKQPESIKQFVKQNTEESIKFFDDYKEALQFAQKVGDVTSDGILTLSDKQLNMIKAWEVTTQGKAVQALKRLQGYVDEVDYKIQGTLDPRNIETNYQVIEKHINDVYKTIDSQRAGLAKFKELTVKKEAEIVGMSDAEVLMQPRESINLVDALNSPNIEADLERAFKENQRFQKYLTPNEEALEIERALSTALANTASGMDWSPRKRFQDIRSGVESLLNKESIAELSSVHKEVASALKANGYPPDAISQQGDLIDSLLKRLNRLMGNAGKLEDLDLRRIQRALAEEKGMSPLALELSKNGNIEEIQGLVSGLLSNKSLQTAFNEMVPSSKELAILDASLGAKVAAAKSPEDIAAILRDISVAAQASKVDKMLQPLGEISERAATESALLQKNLALAGDDPVVNREVIISALNTSESAASVGRHIANEFKLNFESNLPKTLDKIKARRKATADAPEIENFDKRLNFHLVSAMHDTFTGKNPKAIDHLIEKGFAESGSLPELMDVLYPIKRLASTISSSRASAELKGLTDFFSKGFAPKYRRLEAIRKFTKIAPNSPLYDYERMLSGTDPSKVPPLWAIRNKAMEAEAGLKEAYRIKHGKEMPEHYWEKIALSDRATDPEYLREFFDRPNLPAPLTDAQLIDYAKALPYRYLATTPGDMVDGFVKTAVSADAGRRFLSTLAKLPAPDSQVPYIIDITDPAFSKAIPVGVPLGVGNGKPGGNVPQEYRKLVDKEGVPLPIQGLNIKGKYVHADNLRVHPDLYDTINRSWKSTEDGGGHIENFFAESANFIKHSTLVGSPAYFLSTMMGQVSKMSGFSLGKSLGMTRVGSDIRNYNPELMQRAISSGLNMNSVMRNVKGIGDYMLGNTPLKELTQATKNNPLEAMRRDPTLKEKAGAAVHQAGAFLQDFDIAAMEPLMFDIIRDAQMGAWAYKTSELWETMGRTLMRGGKTYQEALHEVEKTASSIVNKHLGSMHRTWLSDDMRKNWFNLTLAPGISQSRLATVVDGFMAMRDTVAQKLFGKAAKPLGSGSFAYGITGKEAQEAYRADALRMFTFGLGATYVFANAMSYALNGYSSFQNAPGKEDQVRIGMNYFKPSVFGFDSIFNRIVRSSPGIGTAIDYGRSQILGDPRVSDSLLTATARSVTSLAHPAIGMGGEMAANKITGQGTPIVVPGAGMENVENVARYAASEYAPWIELASIPVNMLQGEGPVKTDILTGQNLGFPSTLGEVLGAYATHSPPGSEYSKGVQAIKVSVMRKLRAEVESAYVAAANMPDGEERESLLAEADARAREGISIPKALAKELGMDRISLPPKVMKDIRTKAFHEESWDIRKAVKSVRATAADRSDDLLNPDRTAIGEALAETVGGTL